MDVSSWLLIKDGADSEEYHNIGFFSLCPNSCIAANTGYIEDDVESCNCDTASICGLPKNGAGHVDDHVNKKYKLNGGNSSTWMSNAAFKDEAETRIDEVNVNEMEDRLFWEMCMKVPMNHHYESQILDYQ